MYITVGSGKNLGGQNDIHAYKCSLVDIHKVPCYIITCSCCISMHGHGFA